MTVVRSESVTLEELQRQHPNLTHLVISPGPGHPLTDSGISMPAIKAYAGKIPILGVCMGLQCLYAAYGGDVVKAGEVVHGKTSAVMHDGKGLFKGVTQGVQATRYHSLAADLDSLPAELEVTSRTEGGIVMGLRHREYVLEAVQYHPESILSEEGKEMFNNFLGWKSGTWASTPGFESAGTSVHANGTAKATPDTKVGPSAAALPTILQKIEDRRSLDVSKAQATPGAKPADLDSLINLHVSPPLISFHQRLLAQTPSTDGTPHMALLGEIKRASPSKGDLVDASSPSSPAIALSYALAGASVISVLTEPTWFKGSLEDMRAVRAAVDSLPNRPAILRKDFILDSYQIDEARVYGADTVLLIVAMLTDEKLAELYQYSLLRGMEPLVEVNNASELARALKVGAKVIGVNNRNLHDFEVDMGTTSRIADVIKQQHGEEGAKVILIALSGITGREDVVRYQAQGVGGVLVGESLMKATDKGALVRSLLGVSEPVVCPPTCPFDAADRTQVVKTASPPRPLVKICGVKSSVAALAAAEAGADFIGLVFAPGSKRVISIPLAKEIMLAVRSRPLHGERPTTDLSGANDWFSLQSARLASHPRKPLFVGVFQNPTLASLIATIDELHLDAVQLHGAEPVEWARLLSVPVFKAFHVGGDIGEHDLRVREATRAGYHSAAVLDTIIGTGAGALSGGAGKPFDWSIARRLTDSRGPQFSRLPILLAGGLDLTNVRTAIDQVQPWCIDTSGGVETDREKDPVKIREFIRLVKTAD